jgi:hypothetical protein
MISPAPAEPNCRIAIHSSGCSRNASATTKTPSPAYCNARDEFERASFSATTPTSMNAANTRNKFQRPVNAQREKLKLNSGVKRSMLAVSATQANSATPKWA